jgi:hypothetical protein
MQFGLASMHDLAMYEASGPRDLKLNNKMSTAAVFLDIQKAFDTLACSISCPN